MLTPEQSYTPRLVAGLQSGEIDVAFIRSPFGDGEWLGLELLVDEPMLVVVPAWHHLAGDRSVALASLAGDTFIVFPRASGPVLYDVIIASCQRAGFSPRLGQEAPQIPSIVPLVAAGFGVSVVPESIRQIHTEGVTYLPIEGEAPRAPISLAYRRDNHSAPVRNFVAVAKQHGHSPMSERNRHRSQPKLNSGPHISHLEAERSAEPDA